MRRMTWVALTALLLSCGSGTSTNGTGNPNLGAGSGDSGLSDAASLPLSSDTMASSRRLRAATQGLPLATAATDDFGNTYSRFVNQNNITTYFQGSTTNGSYAACEMLNFARGSYGQIGNADSMMCIATQAASSITDSSFHIQTIEDGESTYKLRFRQILGAGGNIKAFELYVCSDASGTMTQEVYLSQDYSNGDVQMVLKGIAQPDNPQVDTVSYQADITADGINSEGRMTGNKSMSLRYQNLFSNGGNNHHVAQVTQTVTDFTYNAFTCNKNELSSTTCDSGGGSQQILAKMQILDNNSAGDRNLNNLAIGDGAANMVLTGGGSTTTGVQLWTGDNGNTDNGSTTTYGTFVADTTTTPLKTVSATFESVAFTAEQQWDCVGDAEAGIGETVVDDCMGDKSINQDVHLECHGGSGGANLSTAVVP